MTIKNIVVIGSGVMGSGIAANIANAKMKVSLLDIVLKDQNDRNFLSKQAIEKLLLSRPSQLALEEYKNYITAGNIEDNLDDIKNADLIIEVVTEKLSIKQNLYKKIDQIRKKGSIVTSNTSTLPIKQLLENMSENFKKDFLVTHFFNPPRYMRLLELIASPQTTKDNIAIITEFLDKKLGKTIVKAKDTPGFIANRIGCYFLEIGLNEAIKYNIEIDYADELISKPFGIPKTAIFGLWDLIGIDLMPLISSSITNYVPKNDDYNLNYNHHDIIKKMISSGYIGRKGKGGFYRIKKTDDKIIKEIIDLKTGEYKNLSNSIFSKEELTIDKILNRQDKYGQFTRSVITKFISYIVKIAPQIADNIIDIDLAMKLGYNWQFGPFELIDKITNKHLKSIFTDLNIPTPELLNKLENNKFYIEDKYYNNGKYSKIKKEAKIFSLEEYKQTNKPILSSSIADIYDVGKGIICLEIKTKLSTLTLEVFKFIQQAIRLAETNYKAMVIGSDSNNFCAGADLKKFIHYINEKNYNSVEQYIKLGQQTLSMLKHSKVPIISAHKGYALGGGFELLLHSSAVISHLEANGGLVESKVGLIPGFGGTKEYIWQTICNNLTKDQIAERFLNLVDGKKYDNAAQINSAKIFTNHKIVMNIDRVLEEAINLADKLPPNYIPPKKDSLKINANYLKSIESIYNNLNIEGHDKLIANCLYNSFKCDNLDIISEEELLTLERKNFMTLIKENKTIDRINFMLNNGKALKN